jgi:copper chaperone CopZ
MRTWIEFDCGDIPPACGFECGACIQEIKDALEAMPGVQRFAQDLDRRVSIDHDPRKVSAGALAEAISRIGAKWGGSFGVRVVEEKQAAPVARPESTEDIG